MLLSRFFPLKGEGAKSRMDGEAIFFTGRGDPSKLTLK